MISVMSRQITWYEDQAALPPIPTDAGTARARLDAGNASFAALGATGAELRIPVGPETFGLAGPDGLHQEPFAAVLGCSDARVPVELVLGQDTNDLFVVRVAGNVPGSDCVGSLHYAVEHLTSLQLVVVLGHSSCGAVTAAVDAMLHPRGYLKLVHDPALRGVIDSLLAGVRMADLALREIHGQAVQDAPGYRDALVAVSALANAAVSATVLAADLHHEVVMGVYDLATRTIGSPGPDGVWRPGLIEAPSDDDALAELLASAAKAAI
jgi:carbonic anhydrase